MGNWTDPDIKNHVIGDNTLRYNLLLEPYAFYNEPIRVFTPYIEKDMHSLPNIVYKDIDREKRDKYHHILEDRSPRYSFAYTSNNRPMQDSYFALGHVYLYQIILGINKLWTIIDYTDSNIPKILVPTKSQITDLFRALLTDQNFRNVKELTTEDSIREALEDLIINADVDYSIVKIVSEKLHISIADATRRLKSPLIVKYLSTTLSKLINNRSSIDSKLLQKTVTNLLHKLKIYIKDNTLDNESMVG